MIRVYLQSHADRYPLSNGIDGIDRTDILDGLAQVYSFYRIELFVSCKTDIPPIGGIRPHWTRSSTRVHSTHLTTFAPHRIRCSHRATARTIHSSHVSHTAHARTFHSSHTTHAAHSSSRWPAGQGSSIAVRISSHSNPFYFTHLGLKVLNGTSIGGLDDFHNASQKPHVFLGVIDVEDRRRNGITVPRQNLI